MKTSTKTLRANLGLENLEDRCTPASFVSNGDLIITGTAFSDSVRVSQVGAWYKVVDNGLTSWYHSSRLWGGDVRFYGYSGNDYFRNDTGLRATAFGHSGNDVLIGGWNNDQLFGGDGNDYLHGMSGNDFLHGGFGLDTGWGGFGFDARVSCEFGAA